MHEVVQGAEKRGSGEYKDEAVAILIELRRVAQERQLEQRFQLAMYQVKPIYIISKIDFR